MLYFKCIIYNSSLTILTHNSKTYISVRILKILSVYVIVNLMHMFFVFFFLHIYKAIRNFCKVKFNKNFQLDFSGQRSKNLFSFNKLIRSCHLGTQFNQNTIRHMNISL